MWKNNSVDKLLEINVDKILEYRKFLKLSQADLADLSGVSRETIIGYESGRRIPTVKTAEKLCLAMGINPSDVISGAGAHYVRVPSDLEVAVELCKRGITPPDTESGRAAAFLTLFDGLNHDGQEEALRLLDLIRRVPEYTDK